MRLRKCIEKYMQPNDPLRAQKIKIPSPNIVVITIKPFKTIVTIKKIDENRALQFIQCDDGEISAVRFRIIEKDTYDWRGYKEFKSGETKLIQKEIDDKINLPLLQLKQFPITGMFGDNNGKSKNIC